MQLETFLEQSARQWPDKTALVCGGRRLSYAEMESRCNRLAHGLIAQGLQRGDRVAVHLDNSVEAVVAIFAILKAGAVFMMVNPTTKTDKLLYVLNDSRAAGIILPGRKVASHAACWTAAPHLRLVVPTASAGPTPPAGDKTLLGFDTLLARHAADTQPPEKRAIDVDLAALVYTSGSTGNPKGVMLTHHDMVSAATSITTYLENTPDEILGHAIRAFVAFKEGCQATEQEVLRHCAACLEDIMVPQSVDICPSLPKSANGKIDKRALAAWEPVHGATP